MTTCYETLNIYLNCEASMKVYLNKGSLFLSLILFQEIWHIFSEGIGIHLYRKFSFKAVVFFKFTMTHFLV